MSAITKWMVAPVFAFGMLVLASPSEAQAQIGVFGGRGLQITIGGGGYPGYRSPYQSQYRSNFGSGYGYGNYQSYRVPSYGGYSGHYNRGHYDRGHYDYHPTEVYRHGNHYHVQPGHYDYHRGSHHRH